MTLRKTTFDDELGATGSRRRTVDRAWLGLGQALAQGLWGLKSPANPGASLRVWRGPSRRAGGWGGALVVAA